MTQSWPKGMDMVTYTFGPANSQMWARLAVKLVLTGSEYLTFNGETLPSALPVLRLNRGEQGEFQLPRVDQEGVRDASGSAFTYWAYDVENDYILGNDVRTIVRHLQPIVGTDTVVDLDSLPAGGYGIPEVPDPATAVTIAEFNDHVNSETPHPFYDNVDLLTSYNLGKI